MMHTNPKQLNLTNNSHCNIDGKSKIPIYAKITAKINSKVNSSLEQKSTNIKDMIIKPKSKLYKYMTIYIIYIYKYFLSIQGQSIYI